MHNLDLILTLAGCLAAALVGGYITQRLGLSPLVGYLIAGIAIGPNTPGVIANPKLAEEFAELGVILLLFGVGLQFHWRELLAVRRVAVPGAIGQSIIATLLGVVVSQNFGWSLTGGLVFGMAISVASTVVLMRVMADNHVLHTPSGHIAVGWLVVEDLFTVLILVLLPVLFGPGKGAEQDSPTGSVWLDVGWSFVKLGTMVAVVFLVGGRVIPWLLEQVAKTRSRELFTLTVMVVALGIAGLAAKVFGASMALGAFLAGMVVGRSDFCLRAATEALPMRDAFAVLFFVSVGMLFEPSYLWVHPWWVAGTLAIILIGKPVAAYSIVRLLSFPRKTALLVAVALAQIGEFSFILADKADDLGVIPEEATNTIVAAAIISITLNPLLFRWVPKLEPWLERWPLRFWPAKKVEPRHPAVPHDVVVSDNEEAVEAPPKHEVVIVGYGPVGEALTRIFQESHLDVTVIEMNLENIRRMKQQGIAAVYGDAAHKESLEAAGVDRAIALILSIPDPQQAQEIIRLAREINPTIKVFARSDHLREVAPLRAKGADAVFAGEGETALTMVEFILRKLGATADQIDRERHRLRHELLEGSVPADLTLLERYRKLPRRRIESETQE